jgi:hypothetical protein
MVIQAMQPARTSVVMVDVLALILKKRSRNLASRADCAS